MRLFCVLFSIFGLRLPFIKSRLFNPLKILQVMGGCFFFIRIHLHGPPRTGDNFISRQIGTVTHVGIVETRNITALESFRDYLFLVSPMVFVFSHASMCGSSIIHGFSAVSNIPTKHLVIVREFDQLGLSFIP